MLGEATLAVEVDVPVCSRGVAPLLSTGTACARYKLHRNSALRMAPLQRFITANRPLGIRHRVSCLCHLKSYGRPHSISSAGQL